MTADLIERARAGDGGAFRQLTEPYGRELQCTATGCSDRSRTPRTPFRTRGWPRGKPSGVRGTGVAAHLALPDRHQPVPHARRSAGRRQAKDGTCRTLNRPTRPGSAKSSGSSPIPMPASRRDRRAGQARGTLRADRIDLPGLRHRPSAPATPPARRPHPARRPRVPRGRGGGHAGLDRQLGQQRPQTGAREPSTPTAADRRPRTAPGRRLTIRGRDRGEVRPRLRVRRSRRARCPPDGRRLHLDAADALRIQGRDATARFCASLFAAGRRFDLVPTRANGQPAFGAYLRAPDGTRHGVGLIVLTLSGDRICAMTRFENTVLPSFGLPRSLPSR